MLVQRLTEPQLRVVHVGFDLVDRGHHAALGEKLLILRRAEVGNADGTDLAGADGLGHGLIHGKGVFVWLVDQQKVQIVRLQFVQALLNARLGGRIAAAGAVQFGGEEQFAAGQAAFPQGSPDNGVVFVHQGRIDQAVAQLQRVQNAALAFFAAHVPGAEADHRQLCAGVQGEKFHGRLLFSLRKLRGEFKTSACGVKKTCT